MFVPSAAFCVQAASGVARLQATILCALLQPQPESYDLFDDVLLMAEGSMIYHGPRTEIVAFFQSCGFTCPERKGVADFLQEITSQKDQVLPSCFPIPDQALTSLIYLLQSTAGHSQNTLASQSHASVLMFHSKPSRHPCQ